MFTNIRGRIKKFIIIDMIILFCILSTIVVAKTYDFTINGKTEVSNTLLWYNDMREVSKNLKGDNDNETITNILWYVRNNMQYEFYWDQRPLKAAWVEMRGDCTDGSRIIQRMLKVHNIRTKLAHGWCYDDYGDRVKHDWLEYKGYKIDWSNNCSKYVRRGSGVW